MQVVAGAEHSMILMDDGAVFAAGSNVFGQLANGKAEQLESLTKVLECTPGSTRLGRGPYISCHRGAAASNSHLLLCVCCVPPLTAIFSLSCRLKPSPKLVA
jgi:alpha-tubulin suppressor-like RCC1 family protein